MWQKWYFWAGVSGLFIFSVVFCLAYQWFFSAPLVMRGENGGILGGETVAPPEEVVDPLRPMYVLVLGHGGAGHAGGGLADTIILAQIVPREQKVNLYSFPRDLWVKMPFSASVSEEREFYSKINATLAIGNSENQYAWRPDVYKGKNGGGKLARAVVGELAGVSVDYFVAVDFAGFKRVIELIAGKEGLRVDVPFAFRDEQYPIEGKEDDPCEWSEEEIASFSGELRGEELEKKFACRYEMIEFAKGKQTIDAETLLKFVRSRHGSSGGDFGRSQRQQAVIQALKDKLLSFSMVTKVPELLVQAFKVVRTDVDLELVKKMLVDYGDLAEFEIETHVIDNKNLLQDGRSSDGQYILRPRAGEEDFSAIKEMIASGSAEVRN